jgi:type II secretory pathway component GspD/PulD (secretin)
MITAATQSRIKKDRTLKMKTIIKLTLAAALASGTLQAIAQDDPLAALRARRAAELSGQPAAAPAPDAAAPASATASQIATTAAAPDQNQIMDVSYTSTPLSTNGITFNFRNAPLNTVLTYMSDAAGFIIVMNTQVRGTVNVISTHPMSKDEAVDLLNSVLNQNNYAAVRDGRTLTIMTKADALHSDIPVKVSNDWNTISNNDEIVTQIIPIRFVDAQQLVVDLSAFVSPNATVVANQAGNSIVITDTQSNIRHLLKIIQSIDSSAEMETEIHVFTLKYANPNDVVAMLSGVFPSSTGGAQNTLNIAGGRGGAAGGGLAALFGGGGGGAGGGGGGGRGGRGGGGNTSQARIQKAQQVLAVADGRTQSVVVTAAKDMMPQIADMIAKVDVDSVRDQQVYVYPLGSADPYEAAQVLQKMFGGPQAGATASTTTSALQTRETQMNSSGGTSSGIGGNTTGGGGARGGGGGTTF